MTKLGKVEKSVKEAHLTIAALGKLGAKVKDAKSLKKKDLEDAIVDCSRLKDSVVALNVLLRLKVIQRLIDMDVNEKNFKMYRNARAREYRKVLREHGFTPNVIRFTRVKSDGGGTLREGRGSVIDVTFEAVIKGIDAIEKKLKTEVDKKSRRQNVFRD